MVSKQEAEGALMEALESWAKSLGNGGITQADGKRYFPTRTMPGFRQAYRDGRLLDQMTGWLPDYRGPRAWSAATRRMVDIVDHDLPCWEEILLDADAPWAAHLTPAQVTTLQRVMRDVYAESARLARARMAAQALIDERRAG